MRPGIRVIDQSTVELTVPLLLLVGREIDIEEGASYEVFVGKNPDDVLLQMKEFMRRLETPLWVTENTDPFEHRVGSSREWIGVVCYYISEPVVRVLNETLWWLNLPQRVVNALSRCGYDTIWHLCQRTEKEIAHCKGIGPKALEQIVEVLNGYGLQIGMEIPPDLQKLLRE